MSAFPLRGARPALRIALALALVLPAALSQTIIAAPPGAPLLPYPILFVTQVPNPGDFTNVASTFGNHRGVVSSAYRGGDLWIRYPDGTLKNLTLAGGFGTSGFQGANSIAVRDPSVHWSGTKAILSMVVGAVAQQYQVQTQYWQIYEVAGLGLNETPVFTRIASQPANYNNVAPIYGGDDRIIFGSDRPRDGASHLYPQRDEYESAFTVSGLWSLQPQFGDLVLLTHSPSGDFTPFLDSYGRVLFTRWDHLQRDQQADADFQASGSNAAYGTYGTFNFASEAAGAAAIADRAEVFPEPRSSRTDLLAGTNLTGHTIEHFFPWQVNEDGTELETLNHIGRHELHSYFNKSMTGDPNLREFISATSGRTNPNSILNCFHLAEDPTQPGRYYATDSPTFFTHSTGQVIRVVAPPTANPDQITIEYLTHRNTFGTTATPGPTHSGRYRDPLPLSDGRIVASHTAETNSDANIGTSTAPRSRYDLRLKLLDTTGPYAVAGTPLTPGLTKSVSWWSPDVSMSYSGPLWEWMAVEVRPRARPPRRAPVLDVPELQAFAQAGVDAAGFRAWMYQQGIALIVARNVTTRDDADRQQPFNLRVAGTGTQSIGAGGTIYDVANLQLYQADLVRGYGGTSNPGAGRRVLARPLHDPAAQNPPNAAGPPGSVAVGADGSIAAIVPARRALTWQLTDPSGTGVVRERYWVSLQPGEVRTCTSCHGANTLTQANLFPPQNVPQALTSLLTWWQAQPALAASLGPAGTGNVGAGAGGPFDVLRINGSTGGAARRVDVALGAPFAVSLSQPPSLAAPSRFILWGAMGAPSPSASISTTVGSLVIEPWHLHPAEPGLFVLANALFADPAALVPASFAPWTSPAWSVPSPLTLTLQGLIEDAANPLDPFGITNGVILRVQ